MTTYNRRQHSGWATAAKRRNEDYLGCTTCGMRHVVPREQAGPREYQPRMPLVRLLNIALSLVVLYEVAIAWVLTTFGEQIRAVFRV